MWKAVVVNEISRKPANSLCPQTGLLPEKVQQRQQKCKLHILATVCVVVVVVAAAGVVCRLSKVAANYTLHLNLYWFFGLSCHSYASTRGIFGNDFSAAKAREGAREREEVRRSMLDLRQHAAGVYFYRCHLFVKPSTVVA